MPDTCGGGEALDQPLAPDPTDLPAVGTQTKTTRKRGVLRGVWGEDSMLLRRKLRALGIEPSYTYSDAALLLQREVQTLRNLMWLYKLPRRRIKIGRGKRPHVLLPEATVRRLKEIIHGP